jgi:hypothetical protein
VKGLQPRRVATSDAVSSSRSFASVCMRLAYTIVTQQSFRL